MAAQDRQGLEAIRSLHRQLDDDANGAVDLSESDEVSKDLTSETCWLTTDEIFQLYNLSKFCWCF